MTKLTKKELFAELRDVVIEAEGADYLVDFIDKELALLEGRSARAKERAAKKKAEGDALRDAIEAALTKEYQGIDAIIAAVVAGGYEGEVTAGKVAARLTQLVKREFAEKELAKEKGKKFMTYRVR